MPSSPICYRSARGNEVGLKKALFFLVACRGFAVDLPGVWEGVIESPARPVVIAVDFRSGTAKLDNAGSSTIDNLAAEDGRIRFQVNVSTQTFRFEAERGDAEIRGTVRLAEREVPFWIRRLPELPAPRDRVEAWQQDLDDVLARFLQYDRSFSSSTRAAFRDRIAQLRGSLRSKSDQQITVELARAVALSGNAHTRLYLIRNRTEVRRLPIRMWWFKDRLQIVRATNEHTDLLGCRVLKIADIDAGAAAERVRGIKAGNESWQRYMSAYFLTSPDILFGAAVISSPGKVVLTVSCGNESREVPLVPLPLRKSAAPVEAWWDLAPAFRDPGESVVAALQPDKAQLYLRKPQENYWFEYLPEDRALYVQYNRSQEARDGMTMQQFTDSLIRAVGERKAQALIFDLRFNTGGNLEVGTPLMKAIAEKLAKIPVFVVTGRATFSAGITHVVQLKQWAHATIAGEPVGDELDFWAEGGNLLLPNSKLTVHYSNGFHSYSRKEYPDRRPYLMDFDVDSVAPDIAVEPSWDDYIAGKDPVLDAISKQIRRASR
jgi:hypothetical protein